MKNLTPIFFGPTSSRYMFLQLTDEHDLSLLGQEASALGALSGSTDWCIAALPVEDWFRDLTPWRADPVFGKQGFGDGAPRTLRRLLEEVIPGIEAEHPAEERAYVLCGYSLAGFFALWAAYQTDRFAGAAAISPSVWYPGWIDYAGARSIRTPRVYLSLGDREEKAKNPIMASVGEAIRTQYRLLADARVRCRLDWNPGNHFVDSDRRVAKGLLWVLEELKKDEADPGAPKGSSDADPPFPDDIAEAEDE